VRSASRMEVQTWKVVQAPGGILRYDAMKHAWQGWFDFID